LRFASFKDIDGGYPSYLLPCMARIIFETQTHGHYPQMPNARYLHCQRTLR